MNKPIRVEGIDVEVQLVFRPEHIPLVMEQFQKVGLPATILDDIINSHIKSGELVSYERWFLEYGQKVINPQMNQKLGRAKEHPTFNGLLKYVLKDIIDASPLLAHFKKKQA